MHISIYLIICILKNSNLISQTQPMPMNTKFQQNENLWLLLIWHVIHCIISVWYFAIWLAETVESYFISTGFLKRYKTIDTGCVQYLTIVLDSDEACRTSEVIELLQCIKRIGLRNVCLYDCEGVLKKSKQIITEKFSRANLYEEASTIASPLLDKEPMNLEFTSFSDGKEAIAQAANYIFTNYYRSGYQKDLPCTESHIDEALKEIGYGQPYPDLMLIYGTARCNLGFPAWRIRYTEMVDALCKAIDDFIRPVILELSIQVVNEQSIFLAITTYGTLEVDELWFPNKSHSQIHHAASKLWYMSQDSFRISKHCNCKSNAVAHGNQI